MWKIILTFKLLMVISVGVISYSQADVPHVFQDGDTIRAEEINENFRQLDSKFVTLADAVENGSSSSGPNENYSYSEKNLSVGQDKLTVLNRLYDIVQLDTLSFGDHDLFTLKFPSTRSYSGFSGKTLDIVGFNLPTTRERRYESGQIYSEKISGYPASIWVSVNQYHDRNSLNAGSPTEAEYDSIEWERHDFYWNQDAEGVYNRLRLSITGPNPSPYNDSESNKKYTLRCDSLDQLRGDFPRSFSWNSRTNVSYSNYGVESAILTEIPSVQEGLSSAIRSCIAKEKISRQFEWRKNRYNTFFDIQVYATILLDDATITNFSYSFDSGEYATDLRERCLTYNINTEAEWNCGAESEAFSRNFSTLIDQQGRLARKPRREEYIQELFKLFDHIVITDIAED